MSKSYKYFSVTKYEWLQPTGDASRIIFYYSIADDELGKSNRLDRSVIVKLSRNAEIKASLEKEREKATSVFKYIQNRIRDTILKNDELPSEITITSYEDDFPPSMDEIGIVLGKWEEVVIENKIGFL